MDWNEAAEGIAEGRMASLRNGWATELYDDAPELLLGFERCWSTRAPVTYELPYRSLVSSAQTHLIVTWAYVPPDLVLVHTLDIGQRVALETRLRTMAEHDDLTGLHNRRFYERRLTEALGHDRVAVIIVDVDHFKFVNDSLGHGPGDDLLREVASTMRSRLREPDVLARFGGDEFAVLLTGPGADRAPEVAGHLVTAIRTLTGVIGDGERGGGGLRRRHDGRGLGGDRRRRHRPVPRQAAGTRPGGGLRRTGRGEPDLAGADPGGHRRGPAAAASPARDPAARRRCRSRVL